MATDPGTKTVTTAGAPVRGAGREGLALVWVFPLPDQPAIPLDRATPMTVGGGGDEAILFKNVFPKTASGKVELASPYLEGKYGARLPSWRPVTPRGNPR